MDKHVEIISVGNELLIGKTLNTNAQWLAKRITSLGLSVNRITVIGDDVKEIAEVLQKAIRRNPQFIITTGGLGPTFDDKTLEGIAEAFGSKLQLNETALKMIKEKYIEYAKKMNHRKFKLTPAKVKMAKLPHGAEPLLNPAGTAPSMAIKKRSVTVFALPGVPSEMKAIFENSLSSTLEAAGGNLKFYEASLHVTGIMESDIAPFIDQIMHNNPHVYIKSHPTDVEKKPRIELHLSTTARDMDKAKRRVDRALIQLSEIVEAKGGKTRTAKTRND